MSNGMYTDNGGDDDEYNFKFVFEGSDDEEPHGEESSEIANEAISRSQTVSGIGIDEAEEFNDESLADMLSNLNAHNTSAIMEEQERLRKEQQAREEADKKAREDAKAKLLKERYEQEKKEREEIRIREEEEARQMEEMLEARRKANPLYKMKESATELATKTAEIAKQKALEAKAAKEAKEKAQLEEKEAKKAEEAKEKEAQLEAKTKNKSDVKKSESQKAENKNEKPQKERKEQTPKEKDKKQQKKKEKPNFEYLATHDKLTGLKNLTAYEIDVQEKDLARLGICFIDLNDLKLANDTHGHDAGDKYINMVAEVLTSVFGEENSYRIGGDEFVILYTVKKGENVEKSLKERIARARTVLAQTAKARRMTYASISIGYAVGDGQKTADELRTQADAEMYKNKQEIKGKASGKKKEKAPEKPVDYDSLLSDEQKMLKEVIRDNHNQASEESTEKIIREVQARCDEIVAVLVASQTFDHLFILQDVESFINLVVEMDNLIDYSYLYVVYENGTQFYGIDEYFDEVTVLFTEIGKTLKSAPYISDKELLKIKGINIFKNIYID